MKQLRSNLLHSFGKVKHDIVELQKSITELSRNQETMMKWIQEAKAKNVELQKKLTESAQSTKLVVKNDEKPKVKVVKKEAKMQTRIIVKKAKKKYVASKTATKFHLITCPFAKNIKPKSKKIFDSKVKALNAGYKPCECVKK